jgi:hypothetical protein
VLFAAFLPQMAHKAHKELPPKNKMGASRIDLKEADDYSPILEEEVTFFRGFNLTGC